MSQYQEKEQPSFLNYQELNPAKILLVEDNEADIILTKKALETIKLKADMIVVRDGEEAISYLKSFHPLPDLILLDLDLPKISGHELLALLKKSEEWRHIPVAIFTASDSMEDIQYAYSLYANCYVIKPINADQFINILRSIKEFWLTIVKLPSVKEAELI